MSRLALLARTSCFLGLFLLPAQILSRRGELAASSRSRILLRFSWRRSGTCTQLLLLTWLFTVARATLKFSIYKEVHSVIASSTRIVRGAVSCLSPTSKRLDLLISRFLYLAIYCFSYLLTSPCLQVSS